MWQKCPLCNGTGLEFMVNSYYIERICTVCNGHKIIHQVTGKPPETEQSKGLSVYEESATTIPSPSTAEWKWDEGLKKLVRIK